MDIIDIGIYSAYALIGLCAIAAIVMPLIQSLSDPKSLVKSGVGVVILVVIFFIGLAMADGTSTNEEVTEATSKYVGAGIITTYACIFIAMFGIVYTEISKIVK
ncbi:MAG: hypothetical protein JXQ90_19850 [Cyclobacteriaceae bacterium]